MPLNEMNVHGEQENERKNERTDAWSDGLTSNNDVGIPTERRQCKLTAVLWFCSSMDVKSLHGHLATSSKNNRWESQTPIARSLALSLAHPLVRKPERMNPLFKC